MLRQSSPPYDPICMYAYLSHKAQRIFRFSFCLCIQKYNYMVIRTLLKICGVPFALEKAATSTTGPLDSS